MVIENVIINSLDDGLGYAFDLRGLGYAYEGKPVLGVVLHFKTLYTEVQGENKVYNVYYDDIDELDRDLENNGYGLEIPHYYEILDTIKEYQESETFKELEKKDNS
jgi:hypothetical protein